GDRCRAGARAARGDARGCLERAAARRAVAKAGTVGRRAHAAGAWTARLLRVDRLPGRQVRLCSLRERRRTGAERRRERRRRRSVRIASGAGGRGCPVRHPVLSAQADRRRGRSDPRAEPLTALLAERQVRWVLASARRAGHDASRWDITRARPSSFRNRPRGLISGAPPLRCRSARAVPARNRAR
ncbi:MAG: hypothetical protein JWP87_1291, partial [Labilithrix sp.]|nr:hypothetical protein [Labilithrix sp.]